MWHRKVNFTSEKAVRHLTGDPVVKDLPSSAGDGDLISVQGTKIPHARGVDRGQTTKPKHCNYRAHTS